MGKAAKSAASIFELIDYPVDIEYPKDGVKKEITGKIERKYLLTTAFDRLRLTVEF